MNWNDLPNVGKLPIVLPLPDYRNIKYRKR